MNSTKAYEILKIKEISSIEEIKSAYRKLSLQHHPDRNFNSESTNVFLQIKQAYNFLLIAKDQDSSVLRQHEEIKQQHNSNSSMYYHKLNIPIGSSIQVINEAFKKLMNEFNNSAKRKSDLIKKCIKFSEVYTKLMKIKLEEENDKLTDCCEDGDYEKENEQEQLPPNKFNLKLCLEEIYNGCIKHQTIIYKNIDRNGTERQQRKSIKVEVKPGSIGGTEITLPLEGDTCYGKINADVIFTIDESPHDIFKRYGHDIEYTEKILPREAILGGKIVIQTLENKPLEWTFEGGITPKTAQRIANFGLPILNEANKSGDLIIKFDIIFDDAQDCKTQVQLSKQLPANDFLDVEAENINISPNQLQKPLKQLPPNEFDLLLSLEEIFCGGFKSQKISTKRIDKSKIVHLDTKTLNIEINSELKNGDKITLEQEGDMCFGKIAADVIFTVCEKPNTIFKRNGCNLEYTAKITQREAILGGELTIPPLNGSESFKCKFHGDITNGEQLHISRNKLPVTSGNNHRGDLVIVFDIFNMSEKLEQDEPIVHDVMITLEQIFNGCSKQVKITRNIIDVGGNEQAEAKILTMDIKPGTPSGTEFTFPREGDQHLKFIPADIVFIVQDRPHNLFRRIGSDIEHTVTLTKSEFNNGGKIKIPTLDGKQKELSLDGIVNEKTVRKFANCGLPIPGKLGKRGNLIVKFNIVDDPQDEPIINYLELSLEEIFSGCVKQLNITKQNFDCNGNQLSIKEEPIEIVVERGFYEGRRFVFEKYGDKYPGKTPADIIFVVRYKEHLQFNFKGYDLYHTAIITESEAKNGVRLDIPTLESEPLIFNSTKIITTQDEVKYSGLGLPYDINKRGDLFLRFNIVDDGLKDPPIEKEITLSLEQIFRGGETKVNITRTSVDSVGIQTTEVKTVTLIIPPGTESGKKFSNVELVIIWIQIEFRVTLYLPFANLNMHTLLEKEMISNLL